MPSIENQPEHACPACGKTDLVERVEDIYTSGYIQLPKPPVFGLARHRRLDVRQIPGVSQLNILSARLAPPQEPVFNGVFFTSKSPSEPRYPADWPALVFLALRYLATAAVVGLAAVFLLRPVLGTWPGWVLFAAAVVWLFWRKFRKERDQAAQIRRDHDRWVGEMEAWRRLLYCSRDDLVFLPGSDRTAGPDDWRMAAA